MSRLSRIVLGVAALVSAPVLAAHAQNSTDPYNPARFTVEPYLSQAWAKRSDVTNDNSYQGTGGFGARVMFGHATASQALSTFFNRARAGAWVTYASAGSDVKQYNFGVQGDFPLLATPGAAGFSLDPFVSLGLGGVHFSGPGPREGTNTTSNDFALTPAVGTLIPITGQIKFRGDLRDAIVFGNSTTNNFIAEAGISIGF